MSGEIEGESVSHQEHKAVKGDRYEVKKPKDSDILRGDGSFVVETDKSIEYAAKKGERYETIRPESSDIWKVIKNMRFRAS